MKDESYPGLPGFTAAELWDMWKNHDREEANCRSTPHSEHVFEMFRAGWLGVVYLRKRIEDRSDNFDSYQTDAEEVFRFLDIYYEDLRAEYTR